MLTTSYPRHRGDLAGCFVEDLARKLVVEQSCEVLVLAPGAAGVPAESACGGLRVRRLAYFWPPRLQRLAYGDGIPANLRRSLVARLNVPALLGAFAAATVALARRFDILHAHWSVLGALALALRPLHRRPVVVTVHGSDLHDSTAAGPLRRITRFAVTRADAVLTPSPDFEHKCRELGARGPCRFVPHGVRLPPPRPRRPDGQPWRIVTVGRLIPERRHLDLIEAFAAVRAVQPAAELEIVGDGPEMPRLRARVAELGLDQAVRLVGQVPTDQVAGRLETADLYVSASTVETFGLAAVEAAACGLPLLTSDVGFPAVLAREGGGWVVPAGDSQALRRVLAEAAADRNRLAAIGDRMRERVEQLRLTWSGAAAKTAAVYQEVLRRPRGRG